MISQPPLVVLVRCVSRTVTNVVMMDRAKIESGRAYINCSLNDEDQHH